MDSNLKAAHENTFTGGMNTVVAPEMLATDQYVAMLNCDVMSTDDGKLGKVTGVKGNVLVYVDLPEGENKTIGVAKNEQGNKLYYAVWNSNGMHTWYEYDISFNTVQKVLQSFSDTGEVDIFNWSKSDKILTADVIDGELLYWTIKGHPPRKINIQKCLSGDYGDVVLEEFTRAFKRPSPFPPEAKYITDETRKTNNLFGNLFKFAIAYIYDDNEKSTYSDFSTVPLPYEEDASGAVGVPEKNNCISVKFLVGGHIVKKVEIVMQKTDPDGGVSDWSTIAVINKEDVEIEDGQYEYLFYNEDVSISVDQDEIDLQYSNMPRDPAVQSNCGGVMVYADFTEGFPTVDIDVSHEIVYSELFIPEEQENVLNNPSFQKVIIEKYKRSRWPDSWRTTVAEVVVGPDVKAGNIFRVKFENIALDYTYTARLTDNARTVAAYFRSQFKVADRFNVREAYVGDISVDSGGYARFRFAIVQRANSSSYVDLNTTVTPVRYNTLKDLGFSTPNEKMGSSYKYGIIYKDEDLRRTLTYAYDESVEIKSINELGDIKKVETLLTIKHKAPEWARYYSIVRTKNLKQNNYIQFIIQKISVHETDRGDKYHDLIVGSLYTYQKLHPNSTIKYEFKKGDRVRLVKKFNATDGWSVPSNVIDYEVISYNNLVIEKINKDITVTKNSNIVTTDEADNNYVGSTITIGDNIEREIIAIDPNGYMIDNIISIDGMTAEESYTFPYYSIKNDRGVLRIKMNPDYPINVIPGEEYPLVEVFTPHQSIGTVASETYFNIGYDFEIIDGNHRGNIQDQTNEDDAIVSIQGIDNYVRNRELPTNTDVKNVQSIFASVEDPSFSDFYVSDMTSRGRASVLDNSKGVVRFDSRIVFSLNRITDTEINGLNIFKPLNRVDYNDGYGAIALVLYSDGRLYIFKTNKTGWVPVKGNIITDQTGEALLAASDKFLPENIIYFTWDGGVGNNPESIVRFENGIFGISPSNGTVFRIGGSGVVPISKIYGIDNLARDYITNASRSGVNMWGGYNKRKSNYVLVIEEYDKIAYRDLFSQVNTSVQLKEHSGDFSIISLPAHGSAEIIVDTIQYNPNQDFVGKDYFSYKPEVGEPVNVCVTVIGADSILTWRPTGEYCINEDGVRTGFVGYTLLEEYDNSTAEYTGNTKPNDPSDPDYVAPVEDTGRCPIGVESIKVATINIGINSQKITFDFESFEHTTITIKKGESYDGEDLATTGEVPSGEYELDVPIGQGVASIFITNDDFSTFKKLSIKSAYMISGYFSDIPSLEELVLDQSSIPLSHNMNFNYLDIASNVSLTKLHVINHQMSSINLTTNNILQDINVSGGENLISLIIGSWSPIRRLVIHDCRFTSPTYSKSYIDSVLASFNAVAPSQAIGYVLQYGASSGTGIVPSQSAKVNYDSLRLKGVSVIGPAPVLPGVNLHAFVSGYPDRPNSYGITTRISNPLFNRQTTHVEVEFFYHGLSVFRQEFISEITAGAVLSDIRDFDLFRDITEGYFRITYTTPNPNGSVDVNYTTDWLPILIILN